MVDNLVGGMFEGNEDEIQCEFPSFDGWYRYWVIMRLNIDENDFDISKNFELIDRKRGLSLRHILISSNLLFANY